MIEFAYELRDQVEPIVGNVVRIAREAGIETPTLDTIYVLIKGLSLRSTPPTT